MCPVIRFLKRKTLKKSMQSFGPRLRNQLILVFVVTISCVLAFVFLTTYQQAKKLLQEQSANITSQYFAQNEYNIEAFMDDVDKDAKLLTLTWDIQDYINRGGWENDFTSIMAARAVFDDIASIMSNNEAILSVFYFGSDGTALGVTERGNYVKARDGKTLDYYAMGIEELVRSDITKTHWLGGYLLSDFYVEKLNDPEGVYDVPCITAARSFNSGGIHRGTLIVNVEESALADLITKSDERNIRKSYLVNTQGEILVHEDETQIGQMAQVFSDISPDIENDYFIRDGMQVNFSYLSTPGWYMISEVSLESVYQDINQLRDWFLIIFIIAIIAAVSISFYWLYRLMRPLDALRQAMHRMEKGEVGEHLDENCRNELGLLGRQFNKMSDSISHLIHRIQTVENEKRTMELEALKMQINPHFLFNTLSNIKYMAMIIQSQTITEAVTALGNMLAPMFRSDSQFWTIGEEIDFLENYIKIMNYRFGNGIRVTYDIPDELRECQILKFVLQPLLENAITHGFEQSEGMGIISLKAEQSGENLLVHISDNGQGISPQKLEELKKNLKNSEKDKSLKKGHIGIVNVHRRLQLYFGPDYGIRITSQEGQGTHLEMLLKIIK